MWPAKLPGEGAAMYEACKAMCDVMAELGVAIDGGKDSLSMAARVDRDTVKAPGALVVSVYAACPDVTATVTPDLKFPDVKSSLLYVRLGKESYRLGGSALAQVYNQIGDQAADLDDAKVSRLTAYSYMCVMTSKIRVSPAREKGIGCHHDNNNNNNNNNISWLSRQRVRSYC